MESDRERALLLLRRIVPIGAPDLIKKYNFTVEEVPEKLLEKPFVWKALLHSLSYKQLLNNFDAIVLSSLLETDVEARSLVTDMIKNKDAIVSEKITKAMITKAHKSCANGICSKVANAFEDALALVPAPVKKRKTKSKKQ